MTPEQEAAFEARYKAEQEAAFQARYDAEQAPPPVASTSEQVLRGEKPPLRPGQYLGGALEFGRTAVQGLGAQVASGVGGLLSGMQDPNTELKGAEMLSPLGGMISAIGSPKARDTQKHVEDYLSYTPKGEAATRFLEKVGPTAESIAETYNDVIYAVTGGNPEAATALKTTVEGGLALMGMGKVADRMTQQGARQAAIKAEMAGLEKQGPLPTNSDGIPSHTVGAAARAVPDQRKGVGMGGLLDDLKAARDKAKTAEGAAWTDFRNIARDVDIEVAPVNELSKHIESSLMDEGFSLADSPKLRSSLNALKNLGTRNAQTGEVLGQSRASARIIELDQIRKQIQTEIPKTRPLNGYTAEQAGLMHMKRLLDDGLDSMFNKAADEVGQAIATGKEALPPNVIRVRDAWMQARATTKEFHTNFDGDKVVRGLLREGVTPERAYQRIVGASAMGASKEAAQTVAALKRVLGDTHPAITDIRKAVIRDTLMPILADKANFRAGVRNIDRLLKDNYRLVDELGIDKAELQRLRKLAHASAEIVNRHPEKFSSGAIVESANRIVIGNSLAKNSAMLRAVNWATKKVFGTHRMSKRELQELLSAESNIPIVTADRPSLVEWVGMSTPGTEYQQDE